MTNLLGEKRGLHCIGWDRGDGSFDEGGPTSHRKIFGLPSFNLLSNIFHQVFIGTGSAVGQLMSIIKSKAWFSPRTPRHTKDQLAGILGLPTTDRIGTYLGTPIF